MVRSRLLGLLACSWGMLSGCDEGLLLPPLPAQDVEWVHFISEHTSGTVSKGSDVRIRFTRDLVKPERVGTLAPDVLELSPSVRGTLEWRSPRELVFDPEEELESGRTYTAALRVPELSRLPLYQFRFSVIAQAYEVRLRGVRSDGTSSPDQTLHGTLVTADVEEAKRVEQVVRASLDRDSLPLSWSHDANGRSHSFTARGIRRLDHKRQLQLNWNGSPIGAISEGTRTIEIPPVDEFSVAEIVPEQDSGSSVAVRFSDPLDPAQDLSGLVRLVGVHSRIRVDGDLVRIYPEVDHPESLTLEIERGVRSHRGIALRTPISSAVAFESQKPGVRFTGDGVILPDNERLTIPFESVGVASIQVSAFEVFSDNMGQFLQVNRLAGTEELGRVGRLLWRKRLSLGEVDSSKWTRHQLDATELLRGHPGSLFRLTLSVTRANSVYRCDASAQPLPPDAPLENMEELQVTETSNWDYYESLNQQLRWQDREDPCKDAYYKYSSQVKSAKNFLASNLGLIAKAGSGDSLRIVASDLRTGDPARRVEVEVYNFQGQSIGSGDTDRQGFAEIETRGVPYYLAARRGKERGYLRLNTSVSVPVTSFDVGGTKVVRGVKGAIYGERGVWRPGDDLHLTFVLHDPEFTLPEDHPAQLHLFDPKGREVLTQTQDRPVGGFYRFDAATPEDAPTGTWTARVQVGGQSFSRPLRIETVRPNRLDVKLELGAEKLELPAKLPKASVFGQWLHGASAAGLATQVAVQLSPLPTRFSTFSEHVFDDPTRSFESESVTLFEGALGADGSVQFEPEIAVASRPAGQLQAQFETRIFEEEGAFSSDYTSVPVHPYPKYVGMKLPKGDAARGMLLTDTKHPVELVAVDATGKLAPNESITLRVYKLQWKWWWDKSGEKLARYSDGSARTAVAQGEVTATGGTATWELEIKYPQWGRYLIRACLESTGHCTGKIFYIDWPAWAGRAREEKAGLGAQTLTLTSDRPEYAVGDVARIRVPLDRNGRVLLSIENGSNVLESRWIEHDPDLADAEMNGGAAMTVEVPITAEMTPNVYVNAIFLQPHQQRENDRPIRMIGYLPIHVVDPTTRLEPRLEVEDTWPSRARARVSVREASGRPITYTLAVVDEGLLGLTRFRTPSLHAEFFQREALGVRTWDMFDQVVGAYTGELERLLALGGDGFEEAAPLPKKPRRFPPVVRFLGPFELARSDEAEHWIDMPEYVGAVRVMVVAGSDGAYGSTDRRVTVRDPITLLASAPRVLGPREELELPVTVFATEEGIESAEVRIETDAHFEVIGPDRFEAQFGRKGEHLQTLRIRARERTGFGEIRLVARSGELQATQQLSLPIRHPNAPTVRQQRIELRPGERFQQSFSPHGIPGSNLASLELSSIPPLNLARRLDDLIRYPHGCVEQTTSAALPQLFLPDLMHLPAARAQEIEGHVRQAIERLRLFQTSDGGFSYWPNGGPSHPWATSYVTHFLTEAAQRGYPVPKAMLEGLAQYQVSQAESFTSAPGGAGAVPLEQAYRLYVLSRLGQPAIGAMNRLRTSVSNAGVERWMLAAAYARSGSATGAIAVGPAEFQTRPASFQHAVRTFRSTLRDRALILGALVELDRISDAQTIAREIADVLASDARLSTHEAGMALMAMAQYSARVGTEAPITAEVQIGGQPARVFQAQAPLAQFSLPELGDQGQLVSLVNRSSGPLFAILSNRGLAATGDEQAESRGLEITATLTNDLGQSAEIDTLAQGKEYRLGVEVRNLRQEKVTHVALTLPIAAGWEIREASDRNNADDPRSESDYQDLRDDRLLAYFELGPRETKRFELAVNAAFRGKYYLPAVVAEAMYDSETRARTQGRWIQIDAPPAVSAAP